MDKILENLEKYSLYLTVFLVPLFFLPIFPNPFITAKLVVIVGGIILFLVVKSVRTLIKGSVDIASGTFDFPVLLLFFATLVSLILKTPNKMEGLFLPGTATLILGGCLIYFFINQLDELEKKGLITTLFLSSIFSSAAYSLTLVKIWSKIPGLPFFMKDPSFNLEGSLLGLALLLAAIIPLGFYLIISTKRFVFKVFYMVGLFIMVLALSALIYSMLPGKAQSPTFAPWNTSWSVTVDALKESPILGIGPANYLTAFSRFVPLSFNLTTLWATRFSFAHNFYFTLITELGLLGLSALFLTIYVVIKAFRSPKSFENLILISLGWTLILLALFPGFISIILVLFTLLSLNSVGKKVHLNLSGFALDLEDKENPVIKRLPAILVAIPILAAVLVLGYYSGRILVGEAFFNQALTALDKNDGLLTYNLLAKSIQVNPYVDRYHIVYSQVNLALARNIAQNKELSDQDKNTITQLIQQAINESKAAVSLNASRASNWELLGSTYQAIMAFSEGADQFVIQSYNQAISLDPTNPNLRLSLGGIYYAKADYDNAIDTFKLATYAKEDLPNSHYNLAIAYREKGDIEKAISEMTIVLSLVQKDSDDWKLAKSELDNLEKKRPAKETQGSENLTPPQKTEKVVQPPLELPQEATPPSMPNTTQP